MKESIFKKIKEIVTKLDENSNVTSLEFQDHNCNVFKFPYTDKYFIHFCGERNFKSFTYKIFLSVKNLNKYKLNSSIFVDHVININLEKKQVDNIVKEIEKRLLENAIKEAESIYNRMINLIHANENEKKIGATLENKLKKLTNNNVNRCSLSNDNLMGDFSFNVKSMNVTIKKYCSNRIKLEFTGNLDEILNILDTSVANV